MIATATAGAARAALALTIAICESDQAAADALLAAYPGEAICTFSAASRLPAWSGRAAATARLRFLLSCGRC